MLKWIAARLDTMGASRKANRVRSTWAARSRSDIRFVKADGVTFRYREAGEGRPIVFAADPPMTLEAYDHLLQIYSKDFRVIIFELPAMKGRTKLMCKFSFSDKNIRFQIEKEAEEF